MENPTAMPEYVLGRSARESERLARQASFLRPSTERVFRQAGIGEGMRVLDVGCGVGDVSLIAAGLVGPAGSVLGIDIDPNVLEVARRRARADGLAHVAFEERAIDRLGLNEIFDAVVGRCFLLYQPDPAAALARLGEQLRPGGVLVVQEPDMSVEVRASPDVPLWGRVRAWIGETFRRGGAHHDIGGRLYPLFRQAGLPGPTLRQNANVCGGAAVRPICEHSADMVRSLLPKMEALGVATAKEVAIETLADRLERDSRAADSQITYMPNVAAWTVKP